MTAASGPTIAAIATPPGVGGIGIVRISGELAPAILTRIFEPGKPNDGFQSHRFYHGWIIDPASQKKIDEVLAVFMRAPHTYTREDVVEIHCHSNYLILQNILSLVLAEGAQPAPAGEFTKRAFLNGRIDLTQAEAVVELLNARTRKGLDLAVNQLHGHLHDTVLKIRSGLVSLKATLEVAIDFPEEDAEILDQGSMTRVLHDEVVTPLSNLIKSAESGKIYREGISVVIIGRPNVGKSSLLNALLEEERAIVTAVPGTTRDLIEEYLDIHGMPVRIVDTAGIRDSSEAVEEIGIQRARKKIESADLILLVIDASQSLTEEDFALRETIGSRTTLLVGNKIDIAPRFTPESLPPSFSSLPAVSLSAKDLTNIGSLEDLIFHTITGGSHLQETDGCVPNVRHREALRRTLSACRLIEQGMARGTPADLLAVDLQAALDHLGDIVGQTTPEEVLEWIFEQFCIGK
jgi:tRNA modification GTPase